MLFLNIIHPLRTTIALLMCLALSGCAFDVVSVKYKPTTLTQLGAPAPAIVLDQEATIPLGTGFPTKLKKGTAWQKVGTIPEGDVYATRDQVLTVEASHIHEAQLVLSGSNVVGFYLPVERSFAPVKAPTLLTFVPRP